MTNRSRSKRLAYLLAPLAVAIATAANFALRGRIGPLISPLYFAAVIFAAWLGGPGPGLLAAALSSLAMNALFLDDDPGPGVAQVVQTVLFLGTAGLISSLADARRSAEQAERHRRVWYEAMLTSVGDGVIAADDRGRVSFLNPAAEGLTGWTRAEADARPIDEVFAVRDEANGRKVESLAGRALRERTVIGTDRPTVLIDRSGSRRPIDGRAAPIWNPDGGPSGVVIVFRDITERRRTEAMMAEHAAIVRSSADAIISKAPDGRITSWNPGAERLFGYTADEALGRPATMLLPPDCTDEMPRMLVKIESGQAVSHYETERIRKDGRRLDISVSISTTRRPDGQVVGTSIIARDVTERRQSERRLAAQYDVSRILAESSDLGQAIPRLLDALASGLRWEMATYWTVDTAAGLLRCGSCWHRGGLAYQRYEKACGSMTYAPGEGLPGRAWSDGEPAWVGEVADDRHFPRAALATAEGLHTGVAFPIVTGGGTIGIVEFLGIESGPPDDALTGMLRVVGGQVGQFIERRRAEAGLKVAETRFRRLSDSGILGILLEDFADRRALDANDTFLSMIGATRADLDAGRINVQALTPTEYRDGDARAIAELMTAGVCEPYVKEFAGPDGRRVSALMGIARLDEVTTQCLAFIIDITERRRAEAALLHREEQLRLALEVAGMASWDWDIEADRIEWSASLDPRHDLPPGRSGASFESFVELVHPDDRATLQAAVRRALDGDDGYDVEFRVVPRGRRPIWMNSRARLIRDASGRPARMIGVGLDITERKQARDDLERAKEAAVAANLSKDQFLAVLSHELRTPLTPVLAAVSAMIDDPSTPTDFLAVLRMVHRNVALEGRLIEDLLDVTKISTGKLRLATEVVDAHELIEQALEICIDDVRAKGLGLDLGLAAASRHIEADPARFQQVVWNLIKNAVKFTPTGGRLTLRTSDHEDGRLVIDVSDTGIGIEPDVLPKVFNAFEQGEATITRRFGGLGLGLAISRSVVDLHGGSLVASSPGRDRGTTFTIAIPTVVPPHDNRLPRRDRRAALAVEAPIGPLRVLLVEDNEDSLHVLARLLRRKGHDVATAQTVASAVAQAESDDFDLLVSDLGLPDGSGLDLIRQIAGRRPIRAIALSGYGMESDIRRSLDSGFAAHLIKPIDFSSLEAAIADVMATSREPDEASGVR